MAAIPSSYEMANRQRYCAQCSPAPDEGIYRESADWYVVGKIYGFDSDRRVPYRGYICDGHLEILEDDGRIEIESQTPYPGTYEWRKEMDEIARRWTPHPSFAAVCGLDLRHYRVRPGAGRDEVRAVARLVDGARTWRAFGARLVKCYGYGIPDDVSAAPPVPCAVCGGSVLDDLQHTEAHGAPVHIRPGCRDAVAAFEARITKLCDIWTYHGFSYLWAMTRDPHPSDESSRTVAMGDPDCDPDADIDLSPPWWPVYRDDLPGRYPEPYLTVTVPNRREVTPQDLYAAFMAALRATFPEAGLDPVRVGLDLGLLPTATAPLYVFDDVWVNGRIVGKCGKS